MKSLQKLLDILRVAGVTVAFYWGYQIGFAETIYNPIAQLHFMILVIIVAVVYFSSRFVIVNIAIYSFSSMETVDVWDCSRL